MTNDEAIKAVDEAFAGVARPALFIRGTCGCEECVEHNATMAAFDPKDLPLDALDNPGWNPICFASDEAFKYLIPGLTRLVFKHPEDYFWQYLVNLNGTERMACLSVRQAAALLSVLSVLDEAHSRTIDDGCGRDEFLQVKAGLERVTRRSKLS